MAERVRLAGWGRTAPTGATVVHPTAVDEVAAAVQAAGPRGVLARGLGRSYGDAAQNAGGVLLDLRGLAGCSPPGPTVTCGAGLSLEALLRRIVPRGWFVPVTPGTRQVSLGGAVAADVHGKNHHRDGALGAHVEALQLVDGRGAVHLLRPGDPLFAATLGGMGLTGVLTEVTLRLLPIGSAQLAVDTRRTDDLEATAAALLEADGRRRYTVAWLDCLAPGALGRGVVTAGDHLPAAAVPGDPLRYAPRTRLTTPALPGRVVGAGTVRAFNALYHRRAPRAVDDVPTPLAAFFHPLDALAGWNRLYGRYGLVQYQFAVPELATVRAVLQLLRQRRAPGLLAVLKRFGAGSDAPLSFPAPGWTLAVDVPADAPDLASTLDAADRLVVEAGGRVYLAKDARVAAALLPAMYPQLERWRELRALADPDRTFRSDLARRLQL